MPRTHIYMLCEENHELAFELATMYMDGCSLEQLAAVRGVKPGWMRQLLERAGMTTMLGIDVYERRVPLQHDVKRRALLFSLARLGFGGATQYIWEDGHPEGFTVDALNDGVVKLKGTTLAGYHLMQDLRKAAGAKVWEDYSRRISRYYDEANRDTLYWTGIVPVKLLVAYLLELTRRVRKKGIE